VVEGARLESVYAGDRIAGSNPVLSATKKQQPFGCCFFVGRNVHLTSVKPID
jgi:hypothetical protein